MTDEIVQTRTQDITPEIDWTKNEEAVTWIEVSIQNRLLIRKEVAELCSQIDGKKRTPETWRQMFYDMREIGFEEYWLAKFKHYFKNKVGAKIYGRMDELVDRERDLAKLVSVGEFIEGKQQGVNVQVNNVTVEKQNKYGI